MFCIDFNRSLYLGRWPRTRTTCLHHHPLGISHPFVFRLVFRSIGSEDCWRRGDGKRPCAHHQYDPSYAWLMSRIIILTAGGHKPISALLSLDTDESAERADSGVGCSALQCTHGARNLRRIAFPSALSLHLCLPTNPPIQPSSPPSPLPPHFPLSAPFRVPLSLSPILRRGNWHHNWQWRRIDHPTPIQQPVNPSRSEPSKIETDRHTKQTAQRSIRISSGDGGPPPTDNRTWQKAELCDH